MYVRLRHAFHAWCEQVYKEKNVSLYTTYTAWQGLQAPVCAKCRHYQMAIAVSDGLGVPPYAWHAWREKAASKSSYMNLAYTKTINEQWQRLVQWEQTWMNNDTRSRNAIAAVATQAIVLICSNEGTQRKHKLSETERFTPQSATSLIDGIDIHMDWWKWVSTTTSV